MRRNFWYLRFKSAIYHWSFWEFKNSCILFTKVCYKFGYLKLIGECFADILRPCSANQQKVTGEEAKTEKEDSLRPALIATRTHLHTHTHTEFEAKLFTRQGDIARPHPLSTVYGRKLNAKTNLLQNHIRSHKQRNKTCQTHCWHKMSLPLGSVLSAALLRVPIWWYFLFGFCFSIFVCNVHPESWYGYNKR